MQDIFRGLKVHGEEVQRIPRSERTIASQKLHRLAEVASENVSASQEPRPTREKETRIDSVSAGTRKSERHTQL